MSCVGGTNIVWQGSIPITKLISTCTFRTESALFTLSQSGANYMYSGNFYKIQLISTNWSYLSFNTYIIGVSKSPNSLSLTTNDYIGVGPAMCYRYMWIWCCCIKFIHLMMFL